MAEEGGGDMHMHTYTVTVWLHLVTFVCFSQYIQWNEFIEIKYKSYSSILQVVINVWMYFFILRDYESAYTSIIKD